MTLRAIFVCGMLVMGSIDAPGAASGLEHPLEVKIVQSGFVGQSGKYWRVDESGKWAVHAIIAGQTQSHAIAQGSLRPEEIVHIRSMLERAGLSIEQSTPARSVNAANVEIRWGPHFMEAALPSGKSPQPDRSSDASASGSPAEVAAAIASLIRALTGQ